MTDRPAQSHPLSTLSGKRLAGSLNNQVAFNLGRQTKGKSQHFGVYIVAETVIVFNRPNAAVAVHAEIKNLHNHEQIASKAAQLGANDDISFLGFT